MNVPGRNTIWRFGERIGVDGAKALLQVQNSGWDTAFGWLMLFRQPVIRTCQVILT